MKSYFVCGECGAVVKCGDETRHYNTECDNEMFLTKVNWLPQREKIMVFEDEIFEEDEKEAGKRS